MSGQRIGVVFPGQGSQCVGMGGAVPEHSPAAADVFARAERVLGYDVRALVANGPEHRLRETRFSQPAIFVVNCALAAAARDLFEPVATAGHSFGELCALTLAGALDVEEALRLVNARALAMHDAAELAPGSMAAVLGLGPEQVATVVAAARSAGRVASATFNAPGQIVVSGDRAAVERAGELALEAGAKRVVPLNVSGAWHSELMEPARERFAPLVAQAPIEAPRFTVISSVDGLPFGDAAGIRRNLVRSVTDEVLWHAAAERLIAERLDLIVEFGGSAVLAPLFKRVPGAPPAVHVGDERQLEKLRARLEAGTPVSARQ